MSPKSIHPVQIIACLIGLLITSKSVVVAQATAVTSDTTQFHGRLYSFEQATQAFHFMWANSFESQIKRNGRSVQMPVREVAAWITSEGILVQPWEGPLFSSDGKVESHYAKNYCTSFEGVSYTNFLPYHASAKTVVFEGKTYTILAEIHTHPVIGAGLLDQDRDFHKSAGLPVYVIEWETIKDLHGAVICPIDSPDLFFYELNPPVQSNTKTGTASN